MKSNEPIVNEDRMKRENSMPDLELSSEQAQEVEAGTAYSPTFRGGIFVASGDVN